jgi:nucleotide-binding universal stress UspA family protein
MEGRAAMLTIRHILFPFDFSAQCVKAAPFVRAMAQRFDARVTLFSTVPPVWEVSPIGTEVTLGQSTDEWVRDLKTQLDQTLPGEFAGLTVDRITDAGDPGWRIAEFAHAHDVDLIMMPTHGAGLFRSMLLGSATAKVLHDVRCPVWTAAHAAEAHGRILPRTILCAVDGSEGSGRLMQWASAFSERVGASLTLLHVVEPITDWPSLASEQARQDQFRAQVREKVERIQRSAGVVAPLRVAVGPIVATVTEAARQDEADLTLIGRGVVTEPLGRLRTHAYGIISRSPCPVLSV